MSSRATRIKRTKKTRSPMFVILAVVLSCFGLLVAGVIGLVQESDSWLSDLPDYSDITDFNIAGPTKIYASDGTTMLAELYLEYRIPIDSSQVSSYVFKATVDTEDVRFYEHNGIDLQGIGRALLVNLGSGGTSEGASTITQQLVRNTLLLDEMTDKTLKRKVREAYLATEIEKIYSKDEILMMYLNSVNYGDGVYGIQAASRHYFSKDASELTLSESAMLAGIPQSPTRLNPVNNYDAAISRRDTVLDRMFSNGDITQQECNDAKAETITLNLEDAPSSGVIQEPYFVDYVKSFLSESYSSKEIFKGGLSVYTTLDMTKQKAAEDACAQALSGQSSDVEVALASVDPDTGYIVAMYGGHDYNADQFNLATQASRQCGSSFKTFTLTAAVEQGISPDDTYSGKSPMQITSSWTVKNDNNESYGNVTLAQATRLSLNTVYAQVIHQIGADKVIDVAHRMGIESDLESVESVTLGTQGVNPLEMASAYGTLATGGIHHDTVCVTKILDSSGKTIYTDPQTSTRALSEDTAKTVTDVLKTDITNGTASLAQLSTRQEAAGKTGTTQNYRDGYFVGYTPQLSTSIWIGTRQEREITYNGSSLYGGSDCCPVWKNYTDAALSGSKIEYFPGESSSSSGSSYSSGSGSQYSASGNETSSSSSSRSSSSSNYNSDDDSTGTSSNSSSSNSNSSSYSN